MRHSKYISALAVLGLCGLIVLATGCSDKFPHRNRRLFSGVSKVEITSRATTIVISGSVRMFAVAKDASGNEVSIGISWKATDGGIVRADKTSGDITGMAAGTTTVAAYVGTVTSDPVEITVVNPVSLVKVVPPAASLPVGQQQRFLAVPQDSQGGILGGIDIALVSPDPNIASVQKAGNGVSVVVGLQAGSTTIGPDQNIGNTDTALLDVTPSAPAGAVGSVVIYPQDTGGGLAVDACHDMPFTALAFTGDSGTGEQVTGVEFTWSSDNTDIASVASATGLVRTFGPGDVTITAATPDNITASVTLHITNNITSIDITPSESRVHVASYEQYLFTAKDAQGVVLPGVALGWASSSPDIATVDSNGRAQGVALGLTRITASCGDVVSLPSALGVITGQAWQQTSSLPTSLYDHTAVVASGQLVVIGGVGGRLGNSGFQEGVYLANIKSDGTISQWLPYPDYPKEIRGHATISYEDNIFVFGGIESGIPEQTQTTIFSTITARMNIADGIWVKNIDLPMGLFSHSIFKTSTAIFIVGGWDGEENQQSVYHTRVKNLTLDPWKLDTSNMLPVGLGKHTAVATDSYAYVIGGNTGGQGDPATPQNRVYYAKINTNGTMLPWTETEPLPVTLLDHASVMAGGYIFVTGGHSNGEDLVSSNNVYYTTIKSDGTIEPWQETTPLPVELDSHAMATHNGYIYVTGGKQTASPDREDRANEVFFSHYLNLVP